MIEVPIFHVNGEDPEAVVCVGELAIEFRQTFGQDVVIDMYLLPPPRPQRGRRPVVHAADHVRARSQQSDSIRELYARAAHHVRRCLQPGGGDHRRDASQEKLQEVFEEVKGGRRRAAYHAPRLRRPAPLGQPRPPDSFAARTDRRRRRRAGRSPKLRPGPRPASSSTPSCRGSSHARVKTRWSRRGTVDWSFAENAGASARWC